MMPSDPGTPAGASCGPRRIILADDHELVRLGLAQLLRRWDPALAITEASDGTQLEVALAQAAPATLVLVDLAMPDFGGESAVCELVTRFPSLPVVVVSGTTDAATMTRLLAAGVAGFLPKALDGHLMLKAIELILAGGRYVPPEVLPGVDPSPVPSAALPPDALGVTPRQREVLALMLEGLPNKIIAARLGIAEATVKMHVTAVLESHGVQSRSELLARYRKSPGPR